MQAWLPLERHLRLLFLLPSVRQEWQGEQGDSILEQRATKSTCASGFNHTRVRWRLSGRLSIPLPLHLWYFQYGKVCPNIVKCVHQTPEERSTHPWSPRERLLRQPKPRAEPLLPRLRQVASPEPVTVAQKMRCSDWPGLGHMPPMEGWTSPTLTLWTESGEGAASPKEMLDVVTRRENGDQKAKITDVHYTPHPRLDWMPNFIFTTKYHMGIFVVCDFLPYSIIETPGQRLCWEFSSL